MSLGDAAWSKILSNWATVKEKGLTDHENWWPAVYRMACAAEGMEPDPAVLAFDETYEGKRVQKFNYKGIAPVTKENAGTVWPTKAGTKP